METTITVQGKNAKNLVSRALYLAYLACNKPFGMGFFQAARLQGRTPTEAEVFRCITGQEDYQGWDASNTRLYADYVFGRMMKIGFTLLPDNEIGCNRDLDERLNPEYQGFSHKFPTTRALLDQAAKELGITYAPKAGSAKEVPHA